MSSLITSPRNQRDRMFSAAGGAPWFSGTEDFTGYMHAALDVLCHDGLPREILDLPAGRGQFTDALRCAAPGIP